MNCTFVIPARNEADRIHNLLSILMDELPPERVIVVDNGSTDDTTEIARRLGAQVVSEPRRGKGYAVYAGVRLAPTSFVFLCDADIEGFTLAPALELLASRGPNERLARLALDRSPELAPVTYLTALPLLTSLGYPKMSEPLGGLALVSQSFLLGLHLPGHWGFDVALTMAAIADGAGVREQAVGHISHRSKSLVDYREMAEDVSRTILQSARLLPWDHTDCTRCTSCATDVLRQPVTQLHLP